MTRERNRMTVSPDLFGVETDKVTLSIDRMRFFEPPEGYYGAFSGGKDSCVIKELSRMAGVKVDWHYNLTTVDPPELVHFIRRQHPDVRVERPKETMWKLIVRKRMPPTRLKRYCCDILKERGGSGRIVMTGIRAEESIKRRGRGMTETCYKDTTKRYFHPIIDWTGADVWSFLKGNNVPYCKLYDEGWKRLGCVMCPFGDQRTQAERWPKITEAYHRAILRCFIAADAAGLTARARFVDGEEMWRWWLSGKGKQEDGGLFT